MKDRIQKLINQEQLTSAKFADQIGVQRSSISHILSGRNKPSLEFVQKVLASFHNLNTDWLIFGRGKMYISDEPVSLFSNIPLETPEIQEPEIPEIQNLFQPEPTQTAPIVEEKVNEIPIMDLINNNKPDKKIERIVIFYSDRTFEEYRPS